MNTDRKMAFFSKTEEYRQFTKEKTHATDKYLKKCFNLISQSEKLKVGR